MNNAIVGLSIQKIICKKFDIIPNSEKTIKQFDLVNDIKIENEFSSIIDKAFLELNAKPIKCTTMDIDKYGNEIPYNFILNTSKTLSVRTNFNGTKISPRKVGQAGYKKLNEYFSDIYGKEIVDKSDIKHLVIDHINEILPTFFENLFDADLILWIYKEKKKIKYFILQGDSLINMDFDCDKFYFTRDYYHWIESTTLKYNNISIAEIQVHKERTFKFRFIMKNILPMIERDEKNNETLGITLEKTICDKFNIKYPSHFLTRYSAFMESELKDVVNAAFKKLPKAIKHTGSLKGIRGGDSKCPYDFLLEGNKTLSVKSNIGKMVCPPEVGQPGAKTCYMNFKKIIQENHMDKLVFKKMVFEHIEKILPIYISHLFDSDYLLWIFRSKTNYEYKILNINYAKTFIWNKNEFSFTKKTINDWNESNTLKYFGVPIGEFQVHNNRDCYKFRFNMHNFINIIEEEEKNEK